MCSGGEQVLGVNNVTGFALRRPYRFVSTVLSAFCGHKDMPVGNGVAVRVEAEKWSLHLEFIHFAVVPPSQHPASFLLLFFRARGRVQAADRFRKCAVD